MNRYRYFVSYFHGNGYGRAIITTDNCLDDDADGQCIASIEKLIQEGTPSSPKVSLLYYRMMADLGETKGGDDEE